MKIGHFNHGTYSLQGELIENCDRVDRPVKSIVNAAHGILESIESTLRREQMKPIPGVIPNHDCVGQRIDLSNHQPIQWIVHPVIENELTESSRGLPQRTCDD